MLEINKFIKKYIHIDITELVKSCNPDDYGIKYDFIDDYNIIHFLLSSDIEMDFDFYQKFVDMLNSKQNMLRFDIEDIEDYLYVNVSMREETDEILEVVCK